MTVLLVRHAVAMRRRDWTEADHLRPLTPKGIAQAEGLVDLLGTFDVTRIFSSPYVRCVQTVQPLAAKLGVAVEEIEELAEGADDAASGLVKGLGETTAVLCSHGDVVPALLSALAPHTYRGLDELPIAKGSTWVVDHHRDKATYLDPPSGKGT
jgi:broad specificity phosphatase PhoE